MALKEMAGTAITEGAVPVANWTLKKLWQELGYMCCYKSNIGDLNEQVRLLHDKRDEIKLEEETAREDSKIINGQVIDWLAKADEQLKEKETTFSEEAVAAKAARRTRVHFPVLTKLYIEFVNVEEIWNNQPAAESFCELRILRVGECYKLLHLVPTHMQNRLQKLEYIEVFCCSSLKEIFEFRRLIVDDEWDATTISESGDQGAQINKMMPFKQSRQAFQNLGVISIWRCHGLRTMLSPSVARGLVKLKILTIGECSIKEVVAAAEGEETEDDSMFPQLHTLVLENLPNLGSFSEGKYNLKRPQVKKIKILRCKNMERFCLGSLSAPKEVEIEVEGAGESVLQELNDSRQEM